MQFHNRINLIWMKLCQVNIRIHDFSRYITTYCFQMNACFSFPLTTVCHRFQKERDYVPSTMTLCDKYYKLVHLRVLLMRRMHLLLEQTKISYILPLIFIVMACVIWTRIDPRVVSWPDPSCRFLHRRVTLDIGHPSDQSRERDCKVDGVSFICLFTLHLVWVVQTNNPRMHLSTWCH